MLSVRSLTWHFFTSLDKQNFHSNVTIMLLSSTILIHISFYLAILGVD